MTERIKSLLPIISIVVLLFGLTRQTLFYMNFNLPINFFISFTEMGLAISKDLILYVPVGVLSILIGEYFIGKADIKFKKNKEQIVKQIDEQDFEKAETNIQIQLDKLKSINTIVITAVSILIFSFLFYEVWVFLSIRKFSNLIQLIGTMVAGTYLGMHVVFPSTAKMIFNTKLKNLFGAMCVAVAAYLLNHLSIEIRNVEEGKFKGTYVRTPTIALKSNDSVYFIGMTEKYIFYYYEKYKTTEIIPIAEVIEFKLKSK